MSATDRTVTLILVVAAVLAWVVVVVIFTTVSPVGDAGAQLGGALALGAAVGLTAWPLLWFASHSGRRDGSGKLTAAARRSALIGLVVSIIVVLRALDVVGLPVVAFLVITAVLVEAAFTLRR